MIADDVTRLIEAGVHAMLIGESLIRAEHTADKVRELLGLGIARCAGRVDHSP